MDGWTCSWRPTLNRYSCISSRALCFLRPLCLSGASDTPGSLGKAWNQEFTHRAWSGLPAEPSPGAAGGPSALSMVPGWPGRLRVQWGQSLGLPRLLAACPALLVLSFPVHPPFSPGYIKVLWVLSVLLPAREWFEDEAALWRSASRLQQLTSRRQLLCCSVPSYCAGGNEAPPDCLFWDSVNCV